MSNNQDQPSGEMDIVADAGEGEAAPAAANARGQAAKPGQPPPKRSLLRRAGSFSYKAAKKVLLITALTSPIRGTPGNMAIRGLQTTGILPTVGNAKSLETPYTDFADQSFADGIPAARLPDVSLQAAHIHNYVFEPDGTDVPVFLLHGERIDAAEAALRLNTTLYHAQNVASSYHHTLKKLTGRDPDVKLLDGLISEGILFNGPQIALLNNGKTIVNNSVCISSLDQTRDASQYKAWIFHAAGNIGMRVDANQFQPQPGGMTYHGPRSVLVGSPYSYSSHCGPVFHCDTSHSGRIKLDDARIGFLPSSISMHGRDEHGREAIHQGWGGTSNSSPAAAAKFSALMERYANYLSEEQIFTALCHSVAQVTQSELKADLAKAKAEGNTVMASHLASQLDRYYASNLPGRHDQHFYDPLVHGFGNISQAALEQADTLCQHMVIYTTHRPHAICRPTTFKARLYLGKQAMPDLHGMYHYRVQLPGEANLNNVVLEGTIPTSDLDKEQVYLVANGIKIRIPAGTTNPLQEFGVTAPENTRMIGSTRGFTGSGPVSEIEILSTAPLGDDVCLTCYNTLAKEDAVSHIADMPAMVDILQSGKKPVSLRMARIVDPDKMEPDLRAIPVAMYPAHLTEADIQRELSRQEQHGDPLPQDKSPPKQNAYWRRRETDKAPNIDYNGQML